MKKQTIFVGIAIVSIAIVLLSGCVESEEAGKEINPNDAEALKANAEQGDILFVNGIHYNPKKCEEYNEFIKALENSYGKKVDWEKVYTNTNILTGALGAFFARFGIPCCRNGVGENSPVSGDYHRIVAYSGGTDTVYRQIENGVLEGDELYLISPQLMIQDDLRRIKDTGNFDKIVIYQGDMLGRLTTINLHSEDGITVINLNGIGHTEWLDVLKKFSEEHGYLPESEDDEEKLAEILDKLHNTPKPDNYGYGTKD